ncbi:MAG: RdgB/HAM1 family non-canonical purine NTP pyrophosphatase [Peptoniphilaceae bacterium]|uniref:RdgB/HAM1 family non-canonical purine NTP pyrophosphatase n=1 Tax=Parvimonas sp. TaxID=1944660 RepID=UPI0025E4626E|nr:RdgB/HAM1 family non-canonical purine NTP pyrophosphatase [Parvimonas sp.]MCI5997202.1 RdgB/HAM1 family non-canonical purine NTP pyrophosphatase [Parvimonas sp.]MDD7764295.1 RdgB/HAM1 family non-canonical purine NTP pyrophosphatase [Peptoniphilaceae bacterium]MDY3051558.1 RdgB/HAM1 family non-canonical purine NTP pyrophosphatase [Parvimonas sp.]
MKKVALSTDNKNKVLEIFDILKHYNFDIVTKQELGINEDFEEIYNTLEENSRLKATKLKEYCNFSVLADDTGLFVNSLNGEPGVFSARYAGVHGDSDANRKKLLKNLEGKEDRTAYFKTVIIFIDEKNNEFLAKGILRGSIAFEERGENGFGYDKIFIPEGYDKTLAELSADEKNKISHRKRALENLKTILGEKYDSSCC